MDQLIMGATALICGVNIFLAGMILYFPTMYFVGVISFIFGTYCIYDFYKSIKE